MQQQNTNIIVYRDKLFLKSESFIPRAYLAFKNLTPIYTGYQKGEGPNGAAIIDIASNGAGTTLGEALFKQAGIVPANLIKKLQSCQPGLIHAHFGKSGVYAMPLASRLNLPLVVTFHGGDATKHQHYEKKPWRVYNRRYPELFQRADTLLAVSDFIRRKLIMRGAPEDKIRVHYNGIDKTRFEAAEKQQEMLFAGRMVEKKGLDTLIAALCRAADQIKGWRIRFLGDGPLRPFAEQALKSSGVEAIFEGWINADDIPGFLSTAAIVLVPSRTASSGDSEGLPMITMEGMMSECALIGSTHAGIPEAIIENKTGLIFNEGDDEQLAAHIIRLIRDKDLRQSLGQAGRARALGQFCLQTQSKNLEAMLEEIIVQKSHDHH